MVVPQTLTSTAIRQKVWLARLGGEGFSDSNVPSLKLVSHKYIPDVGWVGANPQAETGPWWEGKQGGEVNIIIKFIFTITINIVVSDRKIYSMC